MPINIVREDEELKQSLNITIIRRLLSYLKPYMGAVIRTLLLMAAVIVVELFNPYMMKLGIDKYIAEETGKTCF